MFLRSSYLFMLLLYLVAAARASVVISPAPRSWRIGRWHPQSQRNEPALIAGARFENHNLKYGKITVSQKASKTGLKYDWTSQRDLFGQVLPKKQLPLICLGKTRSAILRLQLFVPYGVSVKESMFGFWIQTPVVGPVIWCHSIRIEESLKIYLHLQQSISVWSVGILFMTWSSSCWTPWSKGTKAELTHTWPNCNAHQNPDSSRTWICLDCCKQRRQQA